jgi:hypothetical protein
MKTIFLAFSVLVSLGAPAQYYYNDIIGTMETNRLMKSYLTNKVRTVSSTGFDQRGAKATDFSEFQEVRENGLALKVSSFTSLNKTIIYSKFDAQARVIRMTDSSTAIESVTSYEYDANGRIVLVQNITKDPANDFSQQEIHRWIYNSSGTPEKMWRIINNTDSLEIRFTPDENGNTGNEKTFRKGRETAAIYYYFDERKRLTDIVRYNAKVKKLLPDMLFEYDDKDRVIQKITTTSSTSMGYLIWRYIFDEKGLKTKEALFNDDKQLTGKIEYSYSFGQ